MSKRWMTSAITAAVLAVPATAQAATISFTGGVLTYNAAPGETNNVSFTRATAESDCAQRGAPCVDIIEGAPPITSFPAGLCAEDGLGSVECEQPTSIVANLGDGNDAAFDWYGPSTINGGAGSEVGLHGGDGMDTINGGPGNDSLFGGEGNDTLDGGDGDDFLEGFGGTPRDPVTNGGTDVYVGGPGTDFLDYGGRTELLSITLDGVANDGAPGEADNVGLDVEQVRGGESADTIVGSAASNRLDGWGGNDTVHGGDGDDTMFGDTGNDSTFGGAGQDTIEGGDGDDAVDGGAGVDLLYGDELQTCIPTDCKTGRDTIAAVDGRADTVFCGPGEDTATLDAGDIIPSLGQDVCENVARALPGGGTPGGPGTPVPGGGPSADVTAPQLRDLRMGNVRRGRSTKVRYKLSEAATVTFTAQRRVTKRGKVHWLKARGTLRHQGKAGSHERRFDGRLQGRRLKAGRYRLVAVARDAAGNTSQAKRVAFRVLR